MGLGLEVLIGQGSQAYGFGSLGFKFADFFGDILFVSASNQASYSHDVSRVLLFCLVCCAGITLTPNNLPF